MFADRRREYWKMEHPSGTRTANIDPDIIADFTDLWWNPSESGWGLSLVQHPTRAMFGVWYTYGLDGKRMRALQDHTIVMHPGPMNRGVEIDGRIADDIARSAVTEQVEMGVAVRMACLDVLTRSRRGVPGWPPVGTSL